MPAIVFLGDEVTGAGYRLAGAVVRIPAADDVARLFRRALCDGDLVVLTSSCAAMLPATVIDAAIRHADPLVLIVPDVVDRLEPPDYNTVVARVLGISP